MERYEKERNWTFIIYPDSLPENWKEYLTETGLKIAISPLHDKDINPDGTVKKEHYHVLLIFDGPTTYNRVDKITKEINGTIPKRVISPQGMIRYFTHKDNPEKAQYDEREIITFGGLDIKDIDSLTESMIDEIIKAIIDIIKYKKIRYYSKLIDYLKEEDLRDMLRIARKNGYFFNAYLANERECREKCIDIVKEVNYN